MIALGTNDSADVAAGSEIGLSARIAKMMSLLHSQDVMWVNVPTLLQQVGSYSEDHQQQWDNALVQACVAHPNMRIYDWAHVVKDDWFIDELDPLHVRGLCVARTPDRQRARQGVPVDRRAQCRLRGHHQGAGREAQGLLQPKADHSVQTRPGRAPRASTTGDAAWPSR